jgi:hypothetical protein
MQGLLVPRIEKNEEEGKKLSTKKCKQTNEQKIKAHVTKPIKNCVYFEGFSPLSPMVLAILCKID